MVNFETVVSSVIGAVLTSPVIGGGGALFGYIYGKLADLPADQTAKAWAIWLVAETALANIISSFTEDDIAQTLIKATIYTAGTLIAIEELKKRGLIGENMIFFIVGVRVIAIASSLISCCIRPLQQNSTTI